MATVVPLPGGEVQVSTDGTAVNIGMRVIKMCGSCSRTMSYSMTVCGLKRSIIFV